jgi:sec-independent protein translocase protein TatC
VLSTTNTFHQHLLELRTRVLWIFLAIIVSGAIGFAYRVPLVTFLQQPLGGPLYYTNPAGSFTFSINVSVVVSLFIALPVIVYQLLRFIEPALTTRIKKGLMTKVIFASFGLATAGVVFGYYVIVPLSLNFFAKYSTASLKPLISSDAYLSYLINNLVIFALVFQLPLIILFIDRLRPMSPRALLKYQRYVIVGALIIALILPFTYDPITQFVVALPMIVLYYISVLLVWRAGRKRLKKVHKAERLAKKAALKKAKVLKPAPEPKKAEVATTTAHPGRKPGPPIVRRSLDGIVYRPAPRE